MLSKRQIKLITSLAQKKSRAKYGLFVVEGKKGIDELLKSKFKLETLYTTVEGFDAKPEKTVIISNQELKKISLLTTPQVALAVFHIDADTSKDFNGLILALDGVRDPGNLGTIIRLCDWFGIQSLLCSLDTVDCYNPKVVQATMGSISRVQIVYTELNEFIKNSSLPTYGTFLEGENVYQTNLSLKDAILVLGNEANGISLEIEKLITQKLNIPQFGNLHTTESLNVATATAIFLSEFKRQEMIIEK